MSETPSVNIYLDQLSQAIAVADWDDPDIIVVAEALVLCLKTGQIGAAIIWRLRPILDRLLPQEGSAQ